MNMLGFMLKQHCLNLAQFDILTNNKKHCIIFHSCFLYLNNERNPMFSVDCAPYMADSLVFTAEEIALRDSYATWLPSSIIDCHAHCGRCEDVEFMDRKTYKHMISTFPYFTLEQSDDARALFYPGKIVRSLRFAKTFRGINHKKVNDYLLRNSPLSDRVALFGLPEDVGYTVETMHHPRVSALKMYYSYVEPTAERIYQFFKPEILEVAQSLSIPIILHLPQSYVECLGDLRRLFSDFPRLRISIAHLGPSDFITEGLEDAFMESAEYPYLSLDTSLNNSSEVIRLALKVFGVERIMYGSDEPLNLIRGKVYQHPEKGGRLITRYPYHWVNQDDHKRFGHLAEGLVHWHWIALNALREAIEAYPADMQEVVKQKIFFGNAQNFFGF